MHNIVNTRTKVVNYLIDNIYDKEDFENDTDGLILIKIIENISKILGIIKFIKFIFLKKNSKNVS